MDPAALGTTIIGLDAIRNDEHRTASPAPSAAHARSPGHGTGSSLRTSSAEAPTPWRRRRAASVGRDELEAREVGPIPTGIASRATGSRRRPREPRYRSRAGATFEGRRDGGTRGTRDPPRMPQRTGAAHARAGAVRAPHRAPRSSGTRWTAPCRRWVDHQGRAIRRRRQLPRRPPGPGRIGRQRVNEHVGVDEDRSHGSSPRVRAISSSVESVKPAPWVRRCSTRRIPRVGFRGASAFTR